MLIGMFGRAAIRSSSSFLSFVQMSKRCWRKAGGGECSKVNSESTSGFLVFLFFFPVSIDKFSIGGVVLAVEVVEAQVVEREIVEEEHIILLVILVVKSRNGVVVWGKGR